MNRQEKELKIYEPLINRVVEIINQIKGQVYSFDPENIQDFLLFISQSLKVFRNKIKLLGFIEFYLISVYNQVNTENTCCFPINDIAFENLKKIMEVCINKKGLFKFAIKIYFLIMLIHQKSKGHMNFFKSRRHFIFNFIESYIKLLDHLFKKFINNDSFFQDCENIDIKYLLTLLLCTNNKSEIHKYTSIKKAYNNSCNFSMDKIENHKLRKTDHLYILESFNLIKFTRKKLKSYETQSPLQLRNLFFLFQLQNQIEKIIQKNPKSFPGIQKQFFQIMYQNKMEFVQSLIEILGQELRNNLNLKQKYSFLNSNLGLSIFNIININKTLKDWMMFSIEKCVKSDLFSLNINCFLDVKGTSKILLLIF